MRMQINVWNPLKTIKPQSAKKNIHSLIEKEKKIYKNGRTLHSNRTHSLIEVFARTKNPIGFQANAVRISQRCVYELKYASLSVTETFCHNVNGERRHEESEEWRVLALALACVVPWLAARAHTPSFAIGMSLSCFRCERGSRALVRANGIP